MIESMVACTIPAKPCGSIVAYVRIYSMYPRGHTHSKLQTLYNTITIQRALSQDFLNRNNVPWCQAPKKNSIKLEHEALQNPSG